MESEGHSLELVSPNSVMNADFRRESSFSGICQYPLCQVNCADVLRRAHFVQNGVDSGHRTRRFGLPSLHVLHVRCQFCVNRAVRRNLQFLPV